MAAKHYIPGAVPSSLDDTADYPPLPESYAVPGAAPPPPVSAPPHSTDTWVMPKLIEEPAPVPAPVPQPSTEELLRPFREERLQLRAELAVVNRDRDDLKRRLDAQAGSLRELERRLSEETERSARAREEAAQLHGRSAGIASELEARGAELHGTEDKLRASDRQLRDVEERLRSSEAQQRELEERLRGSEAQLRTGEAERSELRTRLESAQAELALLAKERERQAATQSDAERDRARREAVFAHSQEELSELHKRVAAHGEVLRRVEGQRHVFDAQLREREVMLDEAHSRLREATQARERMGVDLAAAIARAEKAEQRLAMRPEPVVPPPSPPAVVVPEPAAPPAPPQPAIDHQLIDRIASLESELADNRGQLDLLQEKLAAAQRAERALRAELDHQSTQGQSTDAGFALPWPAAQEPTVTPSPVMSTSGEWEAPALTPLLVRTSGDAGIVHVLGRRTTLGRTPDNDVRVEADYVSRHHCVVLVNPEHTILEDLNSTNGVFVNGARVARQELHEGDIITIGEISFRYVLKPAAALP